MTTNEISVLPQQMQFLASESRECLYSGAFGAGKSRAICLKVAMRASVPNSREGLCRKTVVSLKRSTLKTLLEPDGGLPPVLPEGTYEWKKQDGEIRIKGGGTIMLFGLDNPERVASMNLSGCAVDECVELTNDDWTMLRGRIRMNLPNTRNQLYGACNPSSPQHWLAKRFGLDGESKPAANCEAITTAATDNWFLPADYVADLQTMTGVARKRFVEGLWVGSDGLVYDRWNTAQFVSDDMPTEFDRVIVCVDEGYNNPACMLLLAEKDKRLFVVREWYHRQQLEADMIAEAKKWQEDYPIECFVVDPSAAKLRAAMRHANIDAVPADNSVFAGIQAVSARLANDSAGRPLLTVHPDCNNLLREFGVYEWKKNASGTLKDEPVKMHDHALDSLRYGIVHYDGIRTTPQVREMTVDNVANDDAIWGDEMWTEL